MGQRVRALSFLWATLVLGALFGCGATSSSQRCGFIEEALSRSAAYKQTGDYASLRWLAENVLFQGMSQESVFSLLCEGPQRNVVPTEYAAGNHVLLIHTDGQVVTSWEWAERPDDGGEGGEHGR